MSNFETIAIECIGWISTGTFLVSIITPQRNRLHQLGVFTAITTCIYAYAHGATAIWVKWVFAFFFHIYMIWKIKQTTTREASTVSST